MQWFAFHLLNAENLLLWWDKLWPNGIHFKNRLKWVLKWKINPSLFTLARFYFLACLRSAFLYILNNLNFVRTFSNYKQSHNTGTSYFMFIFLRSYENMFHFPANAVNIRSLTIYLRQRVCWGSFLTPSIVMQIVKILKWI